MKTPILRHLYLVCHVAGPVFRPHRQRSTVIEKTVFYFHESAPFVFCGFSIRHNCDPSLKGIETIQEKSYDDL